jgi:thiamine monophosphate kinase
VTVTAIGEAYEQALTPSSKAAPGMDVIVTGYVGGEPCGEEYRGDSYSNR